MAISFDAGMTQSDAGNALRKASTFWSALQYSVPGFMLLPFLRTGHTNLITRKKEVTRERGTCPPSGIPLSATTDPCGFFGRGGWEPIIGKEPLPFA